MFGPELRSLLGNLGHPVQWPGLCIVMTVQLRCTVLPREMRIVNNQGKKQFKSIKRSILEYLKTENKLFKDANYSETAFRICILDTLGTL